MLGQLVRRAAEDETHGTSMGRPVTNLAQATLLGHFIRGPSNVMFPHKDHIYSGPRAEMTSVGPSEIPFIVGSETQNYTRSMLLSFKKNDTVLL